jgi:DinB superfamily
MRRIGMICTVAMISGVMVGQAAPTAPTGPAGEVQGSYGRVKPNILKAADRMPAELYSYKPTPEVRTFGRVVNHVTEAQFHSCGAVNGMAADAMKVPADTASKDEILTALKASFDACDKAYAGVTDANAAELIQAGPAKRSHLGILWGNVSHDNEQYATLALYLRLKGLVPPSSEK